MLWFILHRCLDSTRQPIFKFYFLQDGKHCVFGEIVEGLDDILKMFNETICDEQNRPYQVYTPLKVSKRNNF